ncbi:DUF7007 domain-containing protein [Bradyrhizobium sp. DOA9]|uniref:DUF7007 domain-containing protein n=1 Tax=Bradyrhizobium sp. DOA9 TaxID=1126627 RepID=UPI0004682BA7|nr:hypothetical protein [Bradyrhizobium sp. DOA9]GAJ37460.1 hypothetical protein BDOA9_0200770 [Bradyrhizobium sp. DOA9]
MNASLPHETLPDPTSGNPEVEYGRIADGFLAARVGETAFAMLPARRGGHYLASGWRLGRPIAEWHHADFYGHSGALADEAAFRSMVAENAEHQREKRALGRKDARFAANTPWGASQGATLYADGVICHSTAGHGGFHLSAESNRRVHTLLRSESGWYEEDAEWAIVAITFPQLSTRFERRCAERTIKDSWPDTWEAISSAILQAGESREKDRRALDHAHARDWVVVSAITSKHESGFVEVVATLGGKRGPGTEERRFLVPSAECHVGRFSFVINEARHRVYGGPSDFVAWR